MKCPLCNAPTDIKETRVTDTGYVRRRECFNNHTFKTVETVLTEPKEKRSKYDRN
jgi:transcriptional regulator NrdR family protein